MQIPSISLKLKRIWPGVLLLLCLGTLQAQESQPQPLSLSEAIMTGLENNYGILIADRNVEIAERNDPGCARCRGQ